MRQPHSRNPRPSVLSRHVPVAAAAILLLSLGSLLPASATDLSGALSGTLPAGTYDISDDIHVPSGQTLRLMPGVTFRFEDDFWEEYEFDVYGTLLAEGTAAQPIVFQPASGVPEYNYIKLMSSASVMRYCVVEGVGSVSLASEGGLWIDNCSPVIEDCIVRDATWHGIYVTGSGAQPTIERCQVHGCDGDGIDGDSGAGMTVINTHVHSNSGDGVCLGSGTNRLIGCLIVRNGEDGVDSHGLTDFDALLLNCTIADNSSENLSDGSSMDLYNTIVVGGSDDVQTFHHSCMVSDPSYYRFVDYAGGNYRLADDSPCRDLGTRFGAAATYLPAADIYGNARINGIVDMGAYESLAAPDPGTAGEFFSPMLIQPRMTHPVLRIEGETFPVWIGLLGSYGPGEAWAMLTDPLGGTVSLQVESLTAASILPGSELDMRLYAPGLETIQQLIVRIPAGTPSDLYDIAVGIGPYIYHSIHAVKVLDEEPTSWSLLHITDPHIGYDAEEYTADYRYHVFVEEANLLNPDLVVITGDICENQNLGTAHFCDSLLKITAGLRVPVLIVPGNHDYYNDGDYNPYYPLRYFHVINRFENTHLTLGRAQVFGFSSGHDLGTLELYRCRGPETAALDWAESILAGLDPLLDQPRFFLTHGPNYDYFSWNAQNVARMRDIMNAHDVSLALAGHTHRFETFLNEGDNWFGRNDFEHEDDWGRDVLFPGFPLHTQTSSLGKEEHLPIERVDREWHTGLAEVGPPPAPHRRGLFGDDIGWRYIQVTDRAVEFFTADTDGDGYRNTEDPWLLGDLQFSRLVEPDGTIVATVDNVHYETWSDLRYYVPSDPLEEYTVSGGTLVRRHGDGLFEIAAALLPSGGSHAVALTPGASGVADDTDDSTRGRFGERLALRAGCNPFRDGLQFEISGLSEAGPEALRIFDSAGRAVRDLTAHVAGDLAQELRWDGRDEGGRDLPPGIYYARVDDAGRTLTTRIVKVQ